MAAPDERDPRYSYYLIERSNVPDNDRFNGFSRDAEAERLGTALGLDLVHLPLTEDEARRVDALPGRRRVEGGYAQAVSTEYTPGMELAGVPAVRKQGLDGAGVKVAVIDSGLDQGYFPAFASIESGKSFVAGEAWDDDPNGHGSHVAGTVASREYGIAPGATIVPIKGLSHGGVGSYAGLIKCADYAASVGALVANGSFGGPGGSAGADHPLSKAFDALARRAVTAVAAGNDQRGSRAMLADSQTPAASRDAVTVAAVDDGGKLADFSNWGQCVDVAACGVAVSSLGGVLSGTSMAAPHVAGIAALLVGAGYSLTEVRQEILAGARDSPLHAYQEGQGLLWAPASLARLRPDCGPAPTLSGAMSDYWRRRRQWAACRTATEDSERSAS